VKTLQQILVQFLLFPHSSFSMIFQINDFLGNKLAETFIFERLIQLFKQFRIYYFLCFIAIAVGLIAVAFLKKGEFVLYLNSLHTDSLNEVFIVITKLGEWIGGILIGASILLFAKTKHFVVFLVAVLISSLSSQLLKREVYPQEKRPSYVFEDLKEIENFKRHIYYTFPSGHTTASFTFYTAFVFAFRRKRIQVLAFTVATLVGLSRIYLGQHYLYDVVAGAVLGLIITSICNYFIVRYLQDKERLNKTLFPL